MKGVQASKIFNFTGQISSSTESRKLSNGKDFDYFWWGRWQDYLFGQVDSLVMFVVIFDLCLGAIVNPEWSGDLISNSEIYIR